MDTSTAVWIDDVGTCWDLDKLAERHPRCRGGDFHVYHTETGQKWAPRCPVSLSASEKERVFDQSETDRIRLRKYREFLRLQKLPKPSKEA